MDEFNAGYEPVHPSPVDVGGGIEIAVRPAAWPA
jgi:hypothetical protein